MSALQRRAALWLLGVALATQPGCGCLTPPVNGKQHVLFFGTELPNGAVRGMSQDVLIPEARHYNGYLEDNYGVDFTGTTLVAEGDTLTVLETTRTDEGYRVRARCDLDGPASSAELRVKVMAGSEVRYQDAFDLHCLVATDVVLPRLQPRVRAGTKLVVNAVVHGTNELGQVLASGGHGWALEPLQGPLGLSDEDAPGTLQLTALSAGSGTFLVAGKVRVEVPVEVVEDWTIGLTLDVNGVASFDELYVDAEAVDLDGGQVGSLDGCIFALEVGASPDGGLVDGGIYPEPACAGTLPLDHQAQRARLCATQGEHQSCQDFVP